MHVTTKDAVQTEEQSKELGLSLGTHLLTSTIEADGAVQLASDKAEITAKVLSTARTSSGGITIQTAIEVKEPEAVIASYPTPDDEAIAFFVSKGFTAKDAQTQVERFGATRILAQRDKEAAEKQADLDKELAMLLDKPAEPAKEPVGGWGKPS